MNAGRTSLCKQLLSSRLEEVEVSACGPHMLDSISKVGVNYRLLLNRKCSPGRTVWPGRILIMSDGFAVCLRLSMRSLLEMSRWKFDFCFWWVLFLVSCLIRLKDTELSENIRLLLRPLRKYPIIIQSQKTLFPWMDIGLAPEWVSGNSHGRSVKFINCTERLASDHMNITSPSPCMQMKFRLKEKSRQKSQQLAAPLSSFEYSGPW